MQGNGREDEDYQDFLSGEDSGIVKNGARAVGFGVYRVQGVLVWRLGLKICGFGLRAAHHSGICV